MALVRNKPRQRHNLPHLILLFRTNISENEVRKKLTRNSRRIEPRKPFSQSYHEGIASKFSLEL